MPPLPAPTMSRSVSFVSVMSPSAISGGAPSQSTVMAALPSSTATTLLSATPCAPASESLSASAEPASFGAHPASPSAASAPAPVIPPIKLRREMLRACACVRSMGILLLYGARRGRARLSNGLSQRASQRAPGRFPRRASYGARSELTPPRPGVLRRAKRWPHAPPAGVIAIVLPVGTAKTKFARFHCRNTLQ